MTISFARNGWGHALHASTWNQVKPRSWIEALRDRRRGTRRYSVMAHCSKYPEIGELVQYRTDNGMATAKIYDVKPCGDPRDMFTLFVLRDRELDEQYNKRG